MEENVNNQFISTVAVPCDPCREKTCLQGFGPGPTQTRLYSYRRLIEEVEEWYYLFSESKHADQLCSAKRRFSCYMAHALTEEKNVRRKRKHFLKTAVSISWILTF